jgi:hypothetical protein
VKTKAAAINIYSCKAIFTLTKFAAKMPTLIPLKMPTIIL